MVPDFSIHPEILTQYHTIMTCTHSNHETEILYFSTPEFYKYAMDELFDYWRNGFTITFSPGPTIPISRNSHQKKV